MDTVSQEEKSFLGIVFEILNRLPKRRKSRFWLLLCGMILVAFLETLVVGFLAVYASTIANPEIILKSERLSRIQTVLHLQALTSVKGLILLMSIAVVALIAIKNIINGIVTYTTKLYSSNISCYLGDQLFDGFLNLPYEWHLSRNSADLIQGVAWRQHFGALLNAAMKTLSDILIVAIMLITLVIVEPLISVLVILVLGASALIIFTKVRNVLDKTAKDERSSMWILNRQVTKAIHGIKEVKIYAREKSFIEIFDELAQRIAKQDTLLLFFNQIPGWILETVGVAILTFSICVMFFVMESSTLKITGTIALLTVTAWRVMPAISRILNSMTQIRRTIPFVHTGFEYLDEIDSESMKKTDPVKTGTEKNPFFREAIIFKGVSFTYNGAHMPALQDIDLTIKKGQTLGVIGTSGSGKSTFADILISLLSPSTGEILIDGSELDESKRREWIQCIGYVPQIPYIFDGTIAENVAFSIDTNKIDRDRVAKCCEMAAMKEFLDELPQGLDTAIGERAVRISGGQKQRVAIARALYHEPQLIIFDEATSALDPKNELVVQQTIYSLKQKMTLIIITHRLSTVENCDIILWLEKGNVRMIGNAQTVLEPYRLSHFENEGNDTDL